MPSPLSYPHSPFSATPSTYSNHGGGLTLVERKKPMPCPWLIMWTKPLRSFLEQQSGHSHGDKNFGLTVNNASFLTIFQYRKNLSL